MIYTTEVQHMCPVAKGAYHGPAPIPEEGKEGARANRRCKEGGFVPGEIWDSGKKEGDNCDGGEREDHMVQGGVFP